MKLISNMATVQVLQGALPRQYTGASIVSKKSLKIRLARHFKEKSASEIDWRVNAGHMLRHELHIVTFHLKALITDK